MKECPNCHAEMGADVNFCTNCGTDLRQVAVSEEKPAPATLEPKAAPVQEAEVKAEDQADSQASGQAINVLSTYWQWLLHAWKKPAEAVAAEKWYGLTTLILEDLFFILAGLTGINKLASSLTTSYPYFSSIITELKSNISSYVMISVVLGQVVVLAINYFGISQPVCSLIGLQFDLECFVLAFCFDGQLETAGNFAQYDGSRWLRCFDLCFAGRKGGKNRPDAVRACDLNHCFDCGYDCGQHVLQGICVQDRVCH